MKTETIILPDSPESAEYRTNISGWISAKGHFYGENEKMARYDGSTHKSCARCGNPVEKQWVYDVCHPCYDVKVFDKYLERDFIPYNPDMVVCIQNTDDYFFDQDSLEEFLFDNEFEAGEIFLEVCEPQYLRQIDDEIWSDVIPIDFEVEDCVSKEIFDLLDVLNKKIGEHKPVSWYPGKKRTTYNYKPEDGG